MAKQTDGESPDMHSIFPHSDMLMTRSPPLAPPANLSDEKASEAVLQIIESSIDVRRRFQFFVWAQAKLAVLLPHQVAICGLYQRSTRELSFEVFNSIPITPPLLSLLTDFRSSLMRQLVGTWLDRGRSVIVDLRELAGESGSSERDRLAASGIVEMLVHGVSRPQRPAELESLFIFTSTDTRMDSTHQSWLDMLLPLLHSTYLRTQATEHDMSRQRAPVKVVPRRGQQRLLITEREKQILGWVREGKSNQQVGELLSISPLTVKNHVQKILRKLEAANRAQAVAKAMSMGLLERSSGFAPLDAVDG